MAARHVGSDRRSAPAPDPPLTAGTAQRPRYCPEDVRDMSSCDEPRVRFAAKGLGRGKVPVGPVVVEGVVHSGEGRPHVVGLEWRGWVSDARTAGRCGVIGYADGRSKLGEDGRVLPLRRTEWVVYSVWKAGWRSSVEVGAAVCSASLIASLKSPGCSDLLSKK